MQKINEAERFRIVAISRIADERIGANQEEKASEQ